MTETMFTILSFTILKKKNMSGKTAEICLLSAVDQSGLHSFNDYIIIAFKGCRYSRLNDLSVRTVGGVRTLFKDNRPVETVLLGKSLENFLTYLHVEKTVGGVKTIMISIKF